MQVADIMLPAVRTIAADSRASRAAALMRDERIGTLPVLENSKCCGFVTDRDLITRAAAEGRSLEDTPVRDVMTPFAITIKEGQTVEDAGRAMRDHRIRRLVVVDDTETPVGMLSIDDLAMSPANRPHIDELLRASAPIAEPDGRPTPSRTPPPREPAAEETAPPPGETNPDMPGTHAERVLHPFERGLHAAAGWVRDTELALGDADPRRAIRNLRAVLHAVRDNLTINESSDFAAQMPDLIRGVFYEGWKPTDGTPAKDRSAEAFLARVERELVDRDDPEQAASAVFKAIQSQVTPGEARQVREMLTKEVQEIWPEA